jgi:hypothetical protein
MTAPDPFALGGRQDDDPVIALLAEMKRLYDLAIPARETVERAITAQGRSWLEADKADDPLFAEVHRLEDAAGAINAQLKKLKPTTIAGAIALLEWTEHMVAPEVRDNVVAGLREIAAREPQS